LTTAKDGVTCEETKIVLGGAASVPFRATEAEQVLNGKKLTGKLIESAAQKAADMSDPVSDIHASEEYRRHLVNVLTKRMINRAWKKVKSSVK